MRSVKPIQCEGNLPTIPLDTSPPAKHIYSISKHSPLISPLLENGLLLLNSRIFHKQNDRIDYAIRRSIVVEAGKKLALISLPMNIAPIQAVFCPNHLGLPCMNVERDSHMLDIAISGFYRAAIDTHRDKIQCVQSSFEGG